MSKINDGIGFMKAGLKRIIANHAARREADQQPTPAPAVELFQPDGPVAEATPVVEPEETPESHPHLFIEVRRPELHVIQTGNDAGLEVATGRYVVSFRRRTAEDGDVPFIVLPAQPRTLPPSPMVEWPGRDRFRLGDPPLDDTTRKQWTGPGAAKSAQQGPRVAKPGADGRYYPVSRVRNSPI